MPQVPLDGLVHVPVGRAVGRAVGVKAPAARRLGRLRGRGRPERRGIGEREKLSPVGHT